ncbi:MAG: FecR domain-containing protein [Ignavibacteriaceae bacterium]|jgi:ferric-dicitrate binding protein FerR (iron transport regulator)
MTTNQNNDTHLDNALPENLAYWVSLSENPELMTLEEKAKLQTWLSASSENQQLFNELKAPWKLMGNLKPVELKVDRWSEIMELIRKEKLHEEEQKPNRLSQILKFYPFRTKPVMVYAYAFAAIILIAVSILFVYPYLRFGDLPGNSLANKNIELQELITANAEHKEVELSDGTVVYLNSASKLRFPKSFSNTAREVYLEGEGYFEVEHNDVPFIVRTPTAVVEDIGTEFNIKVRGEKTQIVVKSGVVAVRSIMSDVNNKVLMSAGKMSEVKKDSSPILPHKVDVERYLAWRNGTLVFEHTPLSDVLAELTRQYNVYCQLSEPTLGRQTLTGTFNNEPLEDVLSAICLTLDLRYKKNEQGVIISR